jgi:gamma-glutamylcyclotransferase (GGCT)/AIG2-like uncharacterized protein YtfP
MFVYGTLKPGGRNYLRYLAGRSSAEQQATLAGAALFSPGPFPFLTCEPDLAAPDDLVHGYLIDLSPAAYVATLAELDQLEDYTPGAANNLYERVEAEVSTATGPRRVWVYVASAKALRLIRADRMRRVPGGVWET